MALAEIIAHKRQEVDGLKATASLSDLLERATPSDRSLHDALRRLHTGFICECKKASPSRGLIRPDFDLEAIAGAFAPFADAVSVLTDRRYFQGDPAFVQRVRAVFHGPVLWKDFILEPWQVAHARVHGADAVLLMLSVLDDDAWRACHDLATKLGVDTLTEVHSPEEARRAADLGAPIIGINNRDLKTLQVDLETTARIRPLLPADRVVVCESGIENHADVRRYRDEVDAFLVGTSLMREPSVEAAIRRLVFGRAKVCGLTRPEDAAQAWRSGALYGGLIFAQGSPRRLASVQAARAVMGGAPLAWVGVFANASPDAVAEAAHTLGLAAVQLHGEETAAQVAAVRRGVPGGTEVWKAVRVRDSIPAPDGPEALGADRLVLDTYRAGARGGTGEVFDWGLLEGIDAAGRERMVLAGGLGPANAAAADTLGCWALDVNSGVESAPGVKDAARVDRFFLALRGTAAMAGGEG